MSIKLQDLLENLKVEYGTPGKSKKHGTGYYAIPKTERANIIRHLVKTLKNDGWERERFSTSEFQRTISEWCFPNALTDMWPKEKRVRAYYSVTSDLRMVVAEFYKLTLSVAEEVSTKEYDPSIHKSPFKDLDRSVFAEMPKPNTEVDEEMSKLLGFCDE